MVLVSGDARREMRIPSQKENLMPMPGCTITHTESGQHGTPVMPDMEDMVLVSGDAKREMLIPSQKENLMPMPGCTITHTESGQHGTPVMPDTEDTVMVFGDARREMLKLSLRQRHITYFIVSGQVGIVVIIVLMDGNGDIPLVNEWYCYPE